MIGKQLQDQLSLMIIRSSMKGKYAVVAIAERYNLTMMQALTLCLLEPNQSIPMKELATFMGCDASNVTGIVEQLVNEKLITRKEASHDRRIKALTLTKKGLVLRDKFLEATTNTRLPHLHTLTDEEVGQLIAILEKATNASFLPSK